MILRMLTKTESYILNNMGIHEEPSLPYKFSSQNLNISHMNRKRVTLFKKCIK